MKNMIAKAITGMMVATMVMGMMTGCGKVNYTSTVTETHSYTDADGNTTTTVKTKTNDNGEVTENETTENIPAQPEVFVATVRFINTTGADLYGLNIASPDSDNWGPNILENDCLENGVRVTYDNAFTYTKDTSIWDMRVFDADGTSVSFEDVDFGRAQDPTDISFEFTQMEDGGYTIIVM